MSNPAMVAEVNRLAENLLATERVLCLPGIGTLRVERVGAKRLSKRSILPPHRVVTFSSREEGEPFSDAVARAAGCDREQAIAVYERWRSYALADGVLTIEGVGVLKQKHFTPDPAFDKQLNPQGYAPMQLHPKRRFDWAIWFGIAAILVAVGFGGYQFLQMQPDPEEEFQVLTTQGVAGGDVAGQQPHALAESVVPQIGGEKNKPAPAANEAPVDADAVSEMALAGKTVHPSNSSGEGNEAIAEASRVFSDEPAADALSASDTTVAPQPLVSGRRYVVLGVFSTPQNAQRAAQSAEKRVPGIHCQVYVFGQKWMVSPFSAEDAAASAQFVNRYNDRLPDIWVYTAR